MINFEKFAKYSKPGPRYTSYPTAVEFKETFDNKAYIESLARYTHLPLSIYTHLPFCKSACYFCGCNVIYTSKEDKKQEYITYLKKELNLIKNYIDTKRNVLQFHFGGGTPTFYDAKSLEVIIKSIRDTFINFDKNAEISCEIDPRFFNEDQMKVLKDYGFNRLSFGIQDFNIDVQTTIHRIQPFKLVENAINIARKYGINNINFDLIYGLPKQNIATFKETLNYALKLKPSRLAIFNYAHVPWIKKTMRKIDEKLLPPPKEKLSILKYTINYLTENNYKMIGMDHFALESDELYKASQNGELKRNFQGYTAKKHTQIVGFGVTSIGEGHDYYVQNYKDYATYKQMLDNELLPIERGVRLNNDDIIRKNVIMKLMNNLVLDIKHIENKFNINFIEYFKDSLSRLQEYIESDLLTIDNDFIKINQTGAMLVRNIVMVFDKYLENMNIQDKKFSKTV
ncbi:oxygen-independent coproporphyrinogen III oxidase [Helicobacter sp. MIT 14-3879]|uniref:oxygen-independent coproporphyrinogen III oxidase n=1 Tax=Helicobacter sp. MIT 14-3879 TaxID=2040649 RepID=UPI000E1EC68C|nr:oxygen-independent coproporphyrinogen III oxidase [Helicobacter sp. MIT 14-3879]RDU65227.1 oxygen-independent coproporphyrinogen III oxidase [Helicobacter sp. MIT 14-3879]